MGKVVEVYLWHANGNPLLADVEHDEPEPYRRNAMGFRSPSERKNDVSLGRSRTLGPPVELENEIESFLIVEEEEDEEDSEAE